MTNFKFKTTYLQFHLLTAYGPSNPNRDDEGQPKQAIVGATTRLRLSSQALKREIRESAYFSLDLQGHVGTRTKRLFDGIQDYLLRHEVEPQAARDAARKVAELFGKLDARKDDSGSFLSSTLAFVSPAEWRLAEELAEKIVEGERLPTEKDLRKLVLRQADGAVDLAMFGRMLADAPEYNREAAVQVGHAITTHAAASQEDWFAAVDDLNKSQGVSGAAHIGEHAFGSGLYYHYVAVNVGLLIENLEGDRELAAKGLEALTRALAQASPGGKRASYAHNPRAAYILAERGPLQPRDLSGAFYKAITGKNQLEASIEALERMIVDLDEAYGTPPLEVRRMQVGKTREPGHVALPAIAEFAAETALAFAMAS